MIDTYVKNRLTPFSRYEDAAKQHWQKEHCPDFARHEYDVDVVDEETSDSDKVFF